MLSVTIYSIFEENFILPIYRQIHLQQPILATNISRTVMSINFEITLKIPILEDKLR